MLELIQENNVIIGIIIGIITLFITMCTLQIYTPHFYVI